MGDRESSIIGIIQQGNRKDVDSEGTVENFEKQNTHIVNVHLGDR